MTPVQLPDELGAHVSSAGGCDLAPGRATEIGSAVLQLFTKTPNQWREPEVGAELAERFRRAHAEHRICATVSHDSYLINLASPDPALFAKSYASFRRELERCTALGVEMVVTHPGNATDGDRARGLAQNAEAVARALEEVPDGPLVLLETTAGAGQVLGRSFEELAEMIERVPAPVRARVGVCFDTCHVYAAGYDLVADYEGVIARFHDTVGLDRLRAFHLNDSQHPLGSRKDRHAEIGQGTLGVEPFAQLVRDGRLAGVPKILETPKGDDPVAADQRNLALLRALRRAGSGIPAPG